jgi:serine/threonine protein phosphatase PrpC
LKLDNEFCKLCSQDGRDWESGATALVAALVNEHLVVANLGDCRGVVGRSHEDIDDISSMEKDGWNALPVVDSGRSRRCLWKQVSEDHSPLRVDEKKRIEDANGWITTVTEISVVQLKRIFLGDEDVVDILKRCFSDRYHSSSKAAAPQRILYLSNVCGELGVSRAIGDRDFKAAFNSPHLNATNEQEWECPLHLIYPVNHSHRFSHDLVSNVPDFQTIRIGGKGISDEFLVLACDGLWDVMDADDAIRVTRDLLFERCWSAKKAAARLAQLAIHLGSSDNITVIVVRFFNREN